MPRLIEQLYGEGEHELLRVAASGPCFGVSAVIDTRLHADPKADVEFRFDVTEDEKTWKPIGGGRGIGTGRVHSFEFRGERLVYGEKQQDGHQYLDGYFPYTTNSATIRCVAIVHAGTLVCSSVDLVADVEQKAVPSDRPCRSIGVVNTVSGSGTSETVSASSTFSATAGNAIVAGCSKPFTGTAATFSDNSGSNTYNPCFTQDNQIAMSYAANIATTASLTVSVTITSNFNTKYLGALEIADVTTAAFDASSTIATTFDSSAPYVSTTNAATAADTGNRLAVGIWREGGSGVAMTGPGSPYTTYVDLGSSTFLMSAGAVSGSTSYTATASAASTLGAYNALSLFVEAAAGGVTGPLVGFKHLGGGGVLIGGRLAFAQSDNRRAA